MEMWMKLAGIVGLAVMVGAAPALAHGKKHASKVFKVDSVVMYQPESVARDRVGDAGALKDYEGRLERDLRVSLAAGPRGKGFSAALVVAVRPGAGAHVWLVSKAAVPADLAGRLTAAAQGEPAVDVRGGPIAFAVVFDAFGGGGPKVVDKQHPLPIPEAWTEGNLASVVTSENLGLAR